MPPLAPPSRINPEKFVLKLLLPTLKFAAPRNTTPVPLTRRECRIVETPSVRDTVQVGEKECKNTLLNYESRLVVATYCQINVLLRRQLALTGDSSGFCFPRERESRSN